MKQKIRLLFWHIIWALTPWWLSTWIFHKTGYILAKRTAKDGKPIQFYFQKERPVEFSKMIWPRRK